MASVRVPLRAETASGDRQGAPRKSVLEEHGVPGSEAELRSLIRQPTSRTIMAQLRDAACRGIDAAVYHPEEGRPADSALARCFSCRVRLACLGLALRAEDPKYRCGWYGGLGPAERDDLAASLATVETPPAPETGMAARAISLRAAGWTVNSIARELGCCRRTIQRYLRKAAA